MAAPLNNLFNIYQFLLRGRFKCPRRRYL